MNRIAVFIVACLAVCISAEALDAGCGGGSGAGLFGRRGGGGLFSRLRARRQQSAQQSATFGLNATRAYTYNVTPDYGFRPTYSVPQAPAGCNCPQNPPAAVPAPDAAPMAIQQKTSAAPTYQIYLSTRPAKTHTHSHVAEDGSTHAWDHNSNPNHVCNIPVIRNGKIVPCGVFQNVQDARKLPVTIAHVVRADSPEVANAALPQTGPATIAPQRAVLSPVIYRATAVRSNCSNGRCATSF